MKISCIQENLSRGLITVNRLATQNINLPILNNILLETRKGQLRLATTNLENGINYFVRGKVLKEGNLTVPASLITNYISSLKENKVDLEVKKEHLEVKTKYDSAEIKGLSAADFPFQYELINKIKKGVVFAIKEGNLRKGIHSVSFAAALDELRPEIAGVFFNFDNRNLTLTATDSYRLAEKGVKLEGKDEKSFKAIVPIKAIQEIAHILEDTDEEARLYFAEGQVLLQVREIDFTARLVEGLYPDYKQIIPQNLSTKVRTSLEDLSQAIKRVSFFAARETSDIRLRLEPHKKEIFISAENAREGSSEAKVKGEIQGREQSIVYNYRYFLDGLANLSSEEVSFETNGPEEPGVLRPWGQNDAFLYLVMPIRS